MLFEGSLVGHRPGRGETAPSQCPPCSAHLWELCRRPEVFEFIYIVLFYWKTYAYSIDVVFAVAKELLYSVFFGFTKPIKRRVKRTLL